MMTAGPRRWLSLLAVCGLLLAAVALPAGAQTAPAVAIDTFRTSRPAGCANPGDNFDLVIGGTTNQGSVGVALISPTGASLTKGSAVATTGRWQTSVVFNYTQTGTYEVRATASTANASVFFEVPCQTPTLEFSPTCFTPNVQTRLRMTGRHFAPAGTGYMYYDVNGTEAQSKIRIVNDNRGVFFADFVVTPSDRGHPGEAADANRTVVAAATWSKCPPGVPPTTTSTSTTTTTLQDTSTTSIPSDTVPDEEPATTTSLKITGTTTTIRPSDPPGPSVTVPPTIELPPVTVGATLTATPELGPAGFVPGVTGTGFPPGPVELRWEPGIGRTIAIAGPDGTFVTRVLVMPNDRLGPRALIATGGTTVAIDAFLVVPSSVQPSGQSVQQINRIRQFNNR